jgi:hypothetical protein
MQQVKYASNEQVVIPVEPLIHDEPVLNEPETILEAEEALIQSLPPSPTPPPPPSIPLTPPPSETPEERYQRITNEPLETKLERIAFRGQGYNQIIITTSTFAFRNFLYNWLCSIKNLPDSDYITHQILIYTVDEDLAKDLIMNRNNNNVYLEHIPRAEKGPLNYNTPAYRKLIQHRTDFIRKVLVDKNYRVLLADNDAVWLQKPLPFLTENYQNYDMLAQNDGNDKNPITCGGFLYLNNTVAMKNVWTKITNEYAQLLIRNPKSTDNEQFMLQRLEKQYSIKNLPLDLFPNGYLYFSKRDPIHEMSKTMVVHNNFVIGAAKKLQRFTKYPGMLWQIDNDLNCQPRK